MSREILAYEKILEIVYTAVCETRLKDGFTINNLQEGTIKETVEIEGNPPNGQSGINNERWLKRYYLLGKNINIFLAPTGWIHKYLPKPYPGLADDLTLVYLLGFRNMEWRDFIKSNIKSNLEPWPPSNMA